jgi:PAP2 superfamily protein
VITHSTETSELKAPVLSGRRALQALITLGIVVGVAWLGASKQFYLEAMTDAFFGFALAGITVVHMRIRPAWRDVVLLAAGCALFSVIDFKVLHYEARLVSLFSIIGLTSFAILAIRSVWELDRKIMLCAWIPAGLLVVSDYFASNLLEWTSRAHPKTLDLYLLYFDGNLGAQIAFSAGQYYSRSLWFHNFSLAAYIGLAIPITLIYAGRLTRFGTKALSSVLAFLITGPIGVLFYNLFPACGPSKLFGASFPFQPFPTLNLHRLFLEPVAIAGPRNAIPSLHMAWTLLAWWYSRGLSGVERAIALLFLVFTVTATLGTGEHWFVDLVVAFPFALMIQAIATYELPWKHRGRLSACLIGLAGTLGWLGLLRYGVKVVGVSPIVGWTLSAATVALIYWKQLQLWRTTSAAEAPALAVGSTYEQGQAPALDAGL